MSMDADYTNSVLASLHHFYGNHVELYRSTRKDKKFMIRDPNGKFVHFGQKGYEDWHEHRDPVRQEQFLKRNQKWKHAPMWTPSHLAYWVLWH